MDAGVQYYGGPTIPFGYSTSGNNYMVQIQSYSNTGGLVQWYVSSTRTTYGPYPLAVQNAWVGAVPQNSNRSINMNHRGATQQFFSKILYFNTTFTSTQMVTLQSFLISQYLTPKATIQTPGSISIGTLAGQTNQALNSIAIGPSAGLSNQSTNTIVINASGLPLNTSQQNGLFVSPINVGNGTADLNYNTTTGEVTFSIFAGQPYFGSPISNSNQLSYQLGSGLIIKFGIATYLGTSGTISLLFNIPFPNFCNAVSVTMSLVGASASYTVSAGTITKTGFSINSNNAIGNYPSWIALGW